jgi:hypothetical protein
MDDLERASTALLAHALSGVLVPGETCQCAIDYTHDPSYGDTCIANEDYLIRSKRRRSTNDFSSYVTLYAITKDRKVTLAVYPHRHGISKERSHATVPLCHYFVSLEKRPGLSAVDQVLPGETRTSDGQYALLQVCTIPSSHLGSYQVNVQIGERDSGPSLPNRERGECSEPGI